MNGIRQLVPPPSGYRLKSILQQFEEAVFGRGLVKTGGESITWTLPCGLTNGLVSDPRLPGEGLACYFLRLLDGVPINPGATGPAGPAGTTPGMDGWTETTIAFTPPEDSGNFIFSVGDALAAFAPQRIVFIEGLGWVKVISVTGTDVVGTVLQRVADLDVPVPVGALVVPTGPAGIPGGTVFQVATPAITPSTGSYTSPVTVAITCTTSGAVIRYTTNGTEPTDSSPAYTTPFTVSATTTVRAKAFKTGWLISAEASRTYTFTPLRFYWGNKDVEFVGGYVDPLAGMETVVADNYTGNYTLSVLFHYWYFIVDDRTPPPVTPSGFSTTHTGGTMNALAGSAQGYTDVDAAGYPCIKANYPTPSDPLCRIYRSLNTNTQGYALSVTRS